MTFDVFIHTLAIIESGDDPYAWGDQGLACGRWQQHPAFTLQWFSTKLLRVRSSWDEIHREALLAFWEHYTCRGDAPLRIAMKFHLGATAVNNGQWDADYERRFNAVQELVF